MTRPPPKRNHTNDGRRGPSGDATKDERDRRVADAIASGRLEGQEPSAEFLADADDYVEGRIDSGEVVARARRRWGLLTD